MKKKNVLMMALSLALLAVIAVGGTLAYMTDTTGPVTNTFTVGQGIEITLDEAEVELVNGVYKEKENAARVQDNEYTNILPGVAHYKDPTVTVNSVPVGGVYVFVKIDGLNTTEEDRYTVTAAFDSTNWKDVGNGIYAYTAGGEQAVAVTETGSLPAVFDSVTFEFENDTKPSTIHQISVVACAVQAGGVQPAEALEAVAWE